jgi:hypothetical protein
MAGQRIRYKETREKGIQESTRTFKSKRGVPYKVRLNLNDMTYAIKNLNSENLIKGGENINNLNVLKQAARERLEGLGVELATESRDRTFGLCKKGYNQDLHERYKK